MESQSLIHTIMLMLGYVIPKIVEGGLQKVGEDIIDNAKKLFSLIQQKFSARPDAAKAFKAYTEDPGPVQQELLEAYLKVALHEDAEFALQVQALTAKTIQIDQSMHNTQVTIQGDGTIVSSVGPNAHAEANINVSQADGKPVADDVVKKAPISIVAIGEKAVAKMEVIIKNLHLPLDEEMMPAQLKVSFVIQLFLYSITMCSLTSSNGVFCLIPLMFTTPVTFGAHALYSYFIAQKNHNPHIQKWSKISGFLSLLPLAGSAVVLFFLVLLYMVLLSLKLTGVIPTPTPGY
jgi:hypothetical protein